MPFTMPNYEMPSRPELGNPLSSAISGLLAGVNAAPGLKKSIYEAKYAPQTIQADIFGKEFAPLAAIASSPLAQAMIGKEGTNQLFAMISQLLQQNISTFGGQPGQGGISSQNQGGSFNPGINGAVSNVMGGGNPNQQQANGSNNPALPSGGNTGTDLAQRAVSPAAEQLHAPQTTFFDPNDPTKVYSQPGPGLVEMSQQGYAAIRAALPQMQDIIKKSPEFLDPGSDLSTNASQMAGWMARHDPSALLHLGKEGKGYVNQYAKKAGIDPEKISRYNDWNQERFQTAEMIKRAYPTLATSDEAMRLVTEGLTPSPGETTKGFQERMYSNMVRAIQLSEQNQQNILNAMPLTQSLQSPSQQNATSTNVAKKSDQDASDYDKYGNNTIGDPQEVFDRNKNNSSSEAVSRQLKNNNADLTYSKGKSAPSGFFWASKDNGKHVMAVHESKREEAKKRKYKEVK